VGASDEQPAFGPALHLVASYPTDGQGTNAALDADVACDVPTPECPVPTDVVLQLRFDRFLLPGSGLAAGLRLFTGDRKTNGVSLRTEYDVIERVLVFRPSRPLEPHTLYTAEVVPSVGVSAGLRAFDRAPLATGPVPLRFSFSTGGGPSAPVATVAAVPETCASISRGPLSRCAGCHSTRPGDETEPPSKYPPMGLDLAGPSGFFYTAIGHVAHQTETGNSAVGPGLESPARFGVQMNLVDPGSPATSYLLYKLLQKPENFQLDENGPGCLSSYHPPVVDGACTPPDAAEIGRMREWFVRGDPMPKDKPALGGSLTPTSIGYAGLVRVAAWIASGASCALP